MTEPAEAEFNALIGFLSRIPALRGPIAKGRFDDGNWWVKFQIDIDHSFAWHAVQELGCVLNYLSLNDRLPTVFFPVSPAPYMNGGPADFLSWAIESRQPDFTPDICAEWLEGRLPRPVEDEGQWQTGD